MAPKSGFSKGWKGFVDHKWIKKFVPISLNEAGQNAEENLQTEDKSAV